MINYLEPRGENSCNSSVHSGIVLSIASTGIFGNTCKTQTVNSSKDILIMFLDIAY